MGKVLGYGANIAIIKQIFENENEIALGRVSGSLTSLYTLIAPIENEIEIT